MALLPPLPPRHTISESLWIVLDKIMSYLKSLTIRGDGKTISVNQTDNGVTISAILPPGKVYLEKEVYFLEVTYIDGDGCPDTQEWHKYTIPIISDSTEDPPTA